MRLGQQNIERDALALKPFIFSKLDVDMPRGVFNALNYGARADGVTDDTAAIQAAMTAADVGGVVYLPKGTYATTGLSLSGHRCLLQGQGLSTVILGAGNTSYVLDFTGWDCPTSGTFVARFGDFAIQGNGTAGIAEGGIKIDAVHNIRLENIAISATGGPCLYVKNSWGHVFDSVIMVRPISADTNDVPYMQWVGYVNAVVARGCGFRNPNNLTDGSAVVLIEDDGTYVTSQSLFSGCWFENMHTPENGSIIESQANNVEFAHSGFFDCQAATGSTTGTQHFWLRGPQNGASQNYGGSMITGMIPGRDTITNRYAYGVRLSQNNNAVMGVQGFQHYNVLIDSGVTGSWIHLGGSYATPGATPIVDNSGNNANDYLLIPKQSWEWSDIILAVAGSSTLPVLQLWNRTSDNESAGLQFGTGPYIRGSGSTNNIYYDAAQHLWRDIDHSTVVLQGDKSNGVKTAYALEIDGALNHDGSTVGLYNATPVAQATTGGAAATFVQNSGNAVNDASTFDGYTLAQIVKALRNVGLLA